MIVAMRWEGFARRAIEKPFLLFYFGPECSGSRSARSCAVKFALVIGLPRTACGSYC